MPIILRDCAWRDEAFARYQAYLAYPLDGSPLEAAGPQVFNELREKVHLALLGWWYPRRPRADGGLHALWQLDYRAAPSAGLPDDAALVARLRELAPERVRTAAHMSISLAGSSWLKWWLRPRTHGCLGGISREWVEIRRRLARQDARNAEWQRDLAVSYQKLFRLTWSTGNQGVAQEYLIECARVLRSMRQAGMSLDGALRDLLAKLDAAAVGT